MDLCMFLSSVVRRSTNTTFTFSRKGNIWAILTQQVLRTVHTLYSHCRTQFWESSGALRMKTFQPCKSCTKLLLQVVLAEEIKQIKLRATRAYLCSLSQGIEMLPAW